MTAQNNLLSITPITDILMIVSNHTDDTRDTPSHRSAVIYIVATTLHIVNLLAAVLSSLVSPQMNDFPHLKHKGVTMMDAGAGMHIPVCSQITLTMQIPQ